MTNFALPFEVSPAGSRCSSPWNPARVKETWQGMDGKTRYYCGYTLHGIKISEVLTEDSPFARNTF